MHCGKDIAEYLLWVILSIRGQDFMSIIHSFFSLLSNSKLQKT